MDDNLTIEERALAWAASWNPSFSGRAVVNGDFTFRSVNDAFCEIVEKTKGELIGKTFSSITATEDLSIEIANAELVKAGASSYYRLPKQYEFIEKNKVRKVNIIILVHGVYDANRKFLFFIATIKRQERNLKAKILNLSDLVDIKKIAYGLTGLLLAVIAAFQEKIIKWISSF